MKSVKWSVTIISLTLCITCMLVARVIAQPLELKFGHIAAPGSLFAICADEFAKRANAKLGDKATVRVFGSAQLGNDRELLRKLKLGTVHFSLPSTVMSSIADEFGFFEMPYLVKNRFHMRAIRDEIFWRTLEPTVRKRGYKIIGLWENGFRVIINNVRPINTPEDLKDIKLRTPRGEWRVKMFKSYGANPTPMAFPEVFVGLQTGVVDGHEGPAHLVYAQKFYEVSDYLSITHHVYTPAYATVGAKYWAGLPKDVREILEATAQGLQEFVYKEAEKMEKDVLKKMKGDFKVINRANMEAFANASDPIYREYGKVVPGALELVRQAQGLGEGL